MGVRKEVQDSGGICFSQPSAAALRGQAAWSASRLWPPLLLLGSDISFNFFNKRKIFISIDTTLG